MSYFLIPRVMAIPLFSCKSGYILWGPHTLNRKTLTCFVKTKPRGSVVITKPLALRMSLVLSQYTSITLPFQIVFNGGWSSMSLYIEKGLLCAHKASWLYYMALYHLITLYESLCFTKGTVYSYYSLCKNKWNTICHVCSGI